MCNKSNFRASVTTKFAKKNEICLKRKWNNTIAFCMKDYFM